MIAGELEGALSDNYNNFFSRKNKDAADKPKVSWIQKAGRAAGKAIDKAGGAEGIGRTVDNVRSLFKKKDPSAAPAEDYQFGLKQGDTGNQTGHQEEEKKKKEKEKLIITGVLIVSGIIVIGGLIWYFNNRSNR